MTLRDGGLGHRTRLVLPVTCLQQTRGFLHARDETILSLEFLGPRVVPGILDTETGYNLRNSSSAPLWLVECEGRHWVRFRISPRFKRLLADAADNLTCFDS